MISHTARRMSLVFSAAVFALLQGLPVAADADRFPAIRSLILRPVL